MFFSSIISHWRRHLVSDFLESWPRPFSASSTWLSFHCSFTFGSSEWRLWIQCGLKIHLRKRQLQTPPPKSSEREPSVSTHIPGPQIACLARGWGACLYFEFLGSACVWVSCFMFEQLWMCPRHSVCHSQLSLLSWMCENCTVCREPQCQPSAKLPGSLVLLSVLACKPLHTLLY